MTKATKFDRQLRIVLDLISLPPDDRYELRTAEVDQVCDTLQVTRTYSRPGFKMEYHECLFVGPRGGVKTIYRNFF